MKTKPPSAVTFISVPRLSDVRPPVWMRCHCTRPSGASFLHPDVIPGAVRGIFADEQTGRYVTAVCGLANGKSILRNDHFASAAVGCRPGDVAQPVQPEDPGITAAFAEGLGLATHEEASVGRRHDPIDLVVVIAAERLHPGQGNGASGFVFGGGGARLGAAAGDEQRDPAARPSRQRHGPCFLNVSWVLSLCSHRRPGRPVAGSGPRSGFSRLLRDNGAEGRQDFGVSLPAQTARCPCFCRGPIDTVNRQVSGERVIRPTGVARIAFRQGSSRLYPARRRSMSAAETVKPVVAGGSGSLTGAIGGSGVLALACEGRRQCIEMQGLHRRSDVDQPLSGAPLRPYSRAGTHRGHVASSQAN